jgi:hypothetical protein
MSDKANDAQTGTDMQVHLARWRTHEDDGCFTLQIEIGNDRALTLVIWKNGDPNSVTVWTGNGEHSFIRGDRWRDEPLDRFKEWTQAAVAPFPAPRRA